MPVISVPQEFNQDDLFVDLRPHFGHSLFLTPSAPDRRPRGAVMTRHLVEERPDQDPLQQVDHRHRPVVLHVAAEPSPLADRPTPRPAVLGTVLALVAVVGALFSAWVGWHVTGPDPGGGMVMGWPEAPAMASAKASTSPGPSN